MNDRISCLAGLILGHTYKYVSQSRLRIIQIISSLNVNRGLRGKYVHFSLAFVQTSIFVRGNVNREWLVTRPSLLSCTYKQVYLSRFWCTVDCAYVRTYFLKFKKSKSMPTRECKLVIFVAPVSMKYCNIAVFELYFQSFIFTTNLFCLDFL